MKIYDTKTILCAECGKNIGKVEYDAVIIQPKCGQCANPMPESDHIIYTIPTLNQHSRMVLQNNAVLPNCII